MRGDSVAPRPGDDPVPRFLLARDADGREYAIDPLDIAAHGELRGDAGRSWVRCGDARLVVDLPRQAVTSLCVNARVVRHAAEVRRRRGC